MQGNPSNRHRVQSVSEDSFALCVLFGLREEDSEEQPPKLFTKRLERKDRHPVTKVEEPDQNNLGRVECEGKLFYTHMRIDAHYGVWDTLFTNKSGRKRKWRIITLKTVVCLDFNTGLLCCNEARVKNIRSQQVETLNFRSKSAWQL